jgi:hypothetical protein
MRRLLEIAAQERHSKRMPESFFTITTGPTTKPIKNTTREELIQFCSDWTAKWTWVRNTTFPGLSQVYATFIDNLNNASNQLRTNSGNPQVVANTL